MSANPLKLAIVSSEKKQLEISRNCAINPTKLNLIVNGWLLPTEEEKQLLARELEKPINELFLESDVK